MNTGDHPRWPHPAIKKSYFQFSLRNDKKVEIELDQFGNTNLYLNGNWNKIYPGDNGDFELTKIGKKVTIYTWHGFMVLQNGYTVRIRVPGYYHGLTYGICGDNNKDKTNDYMTKDGKILPFPPQRGYKECF